MNLESTLSEHTALFHRQSAVAFPFVQRQLNILDMLDISQPVLKPSYMISRLQSALKNSSAIIILISL